MEEVVGLVWLRGNRKIPNLRGILAKFNLGDLQRKGDI